jgi:L-alanine-DL-glutamate epimerase-like enolase superfamily enzyme
MSYPKLTRNENNLEKKFFSNLMALPAGLWMSNFDALCESSSAVDQVKITAIKVIQLDFEHDGCLLKIETDAGLAGYGETGVTSRVARAFLQDRNRLIGADPLSIRTHFHNMTTPVHPLFAPMALISGIDIALWDLAGKILGQPVYKLLGGPFRDGCPMYSHGSYLKDMLDPASCRSWADYINQHPEGFRSFKLGPPFRVQMPYHPIITPAELKLLSQGFGNLREAVGDSVELGLHLHNELDTYSAIAMANTCKPFNINYIEDL